MKAWYRQESEAIDSSSSDITKSCTSRRTWRVVRCVSSTFDSSTLRITLHSWRSCFCADAEAWNDGMKSALVSKSAQQRFSSSRSTVDDFMKLHCATANSNDTAFGLDTRAWTDCTLTSSPLLLSTGGCSVGS